MSIVKWKNRNELFPALSMPEWATNFFKDDDFFDKRWLPLATFEMTTPSVNVKDTKEAYKLEVAAPGMKKDDFKIEVKDGHLCISAETKVEKEEKEDNYTRKEFNYQAFSRSFWMPENVKMDGIKATYTDGILKVNVPKVKVEKEEPAKVIKIS
jgi:HSP20 family protein